MAVNAELKEEVVSRNETQREIDRNTEKTIQDFQEVFKGICRASKIPPIEIETDPSVPPVHQKLRLIPICYKQKLKEHLQELVREGVVTPLE